MAMSLEEKVALINKKRAGDKDIQTRKAERRLKQEEFDKQRKSHTWESIWVTHRLGAGHRQPTKCEKCGMEYIHFKIWPKYCDRIK